MADEFIPHILIAEDNDVTREMMAGVLRAQGFEVSEAIDGDSAFAVVQREEIDLALLDLNMSPAGGFEFITHLQAEGIELPIVIVTADDSSDLLTKANRMGVRQLLHKPVQPTRLVQMVERVLKREGHKPRAVASAAHNVHLTGEQVLDHLLTLAEKALRTHAGPFAAIVTDKDGKILGEGYDQFAYRHDPLSDAEIMALRQAAEKTGSDHLGDCILYCTVAPRLVGQGLITTMGVEHVHYGLRAAELENTKMLENTNPRGLNDRSCLSPVYKRFAHAKMLTWLKQQGA